jgi:hypothetical protein
MITSRTTPAAELRAKLASAEKRLARIAEIHQDDLKGGDPTDSMCHECERPWPCRTHVWAAEERDVIVSWNPVDDDVD